MFPTPFPSLLLFLLSPLFSDIFKNGAAAFSFNSRLAKHLLSDERYGRIVCMIDDWRKKVGEALTMYKSARATPAGVSAMAWPIDSDTLHLWLPFYTFFFQLADEFPPLLPSFSASSIQTLNCLLRSSTPPGFRSLENTYSGQKSPYFIFLEALPSAKMMPFFVFGT